MKKRFLNWRTFFLFIIAGVCLLVLLDVDIGMWESDMKHEAMDRRPDGWDFTGTTGETMAVFLQYDAGRTEFDCQLYVKRRGDIGWFFRYGASGASADGQPINDTAAAVTKLAVENNGNYALLSLNNVGVNKIEIQRSGETVIQNIEPGRPFALVMSHSWNVTLYDSRGCEIVPICRNI